MDGGGQGWGGSWEHQFSFAFCSTISIHLSLSFCLSASDPLSFSSFALLSAARSMPPCSFPHLAGERDVGTKKICNSLSILFSAYLTANVFHLGFSISMSMRSLGCQSQLRGHYWQYRDARVCLTVSDSVCQSEANFSFVWLVRRGRLVVWRSLLCPWSVLCLLCQYCGLWCAAAFPRAVELNDWLRK